MADREEAQIDQEVFDREIAAGKPERVARALAKAAWVRKNRGPASQRAPEAAPPGEVAAGATAPAETAQSPAAQQPAAAAAASAPAPTTTTTAVPRMTPEERAARVAAATGQAVKEGGGRGRGVGETHRMLALVPPSGIQRVEKRQDDKINVWPHLLAEEFVALLVATAVLLVFSIIVDAPSRELANPSLTPNPSKAPWYFLGLQELLRYFHPMIAGVTLPGLGLFGLMAVPYADKNPSLKPDRRKLAILLFTTFVIFWSALTLIGSFFRGPGFNWVWPWVSGIYWDF